MSDMLEKAIVDATALREAAVKNAESLVLEKFSDQIRDAVGTLLEQDDLAAAPDLPADPMADLTPPTDDASDPAAESDTPPSSVMEHIPLAATLKGDDQVEIPLDDLLEQIDKLSEETKFGDNVSADINLEGDDSDEDEVFEVLAEENETDASLEDAVMDKIQELLKVDIDPTVLSGWAGTPVSEIEIAEEELLALEQDSKVREEKDKLRKAVQELSELNESLSNKNTKLQKSLQETTDYVAKLKNAVTSMKDKLESSSVLNAKLLYQNKALKSDSLNERQKDKLVEAISNAETIEEAKVIFETLQSTVGSPSNKKQPKSLSEAIEKSSSLVLSNRRQSSERQKQNPTFDRWKFLAGIDKQQ